jgi:putative endonuclease
MPTSRTILGDWGEDAAGRFLEKQGFQILDRNYRCRWGEIDLVAQDGDDLVFVEVRTRKSKLFGTPQESITEAKAGRLVAACEDYLENRVAGGAQDETHWRIDLVSVHPSRGRDPRIEHLRHAVEL